MAIKQQMQDQEMSPKAAQEMGEQAMGPAVMAAVASVGLSWYYFFLRGDRQRGLFVGLWPPTILAFASYFKQREMHQSLKTLSQPGTTIKDALEGMMGNK